MCGSAARGAALSLLCEAALGGASQLATWRAPPGASERRPCLVRRGSTIAGLLAALCRAECAATGVSLDRHGIIRDLQHPLMSIEMRNQLSHLQESTTAREGTSPCLAAADVAGSVMAKAFALLQLLAGDLAHKVAVADETYSLYRHVLLTAEDERMGEGSKTVATRRVRETPQEGMQRRVFPVFVPAPRAAGARAGRAARAGAPGRGGGNTLKRSE